MNLSKKIIIPVITVMLLGVVILGLSIYSILDNNLDDFYQQNVNKKADILQYQLEKMQNNALNALSWFENSARLSEAFKENDRASAIELGKMAMQSFGLEYFVITDLQGNVFVRAHEPEQYGDSIANQVNIQNAMKGEKTVGIEEGKVVKFSIRAGSPLKDQNGNTIAILSTGYVLSNETFVDQLRKELNAEITIFIENERLMTTLVDEQGERIVGTKLENPQIVETVLNNGQTFYGKSLIQDREYCAAYMPIWDVNRKVVGMFFIGENSDLINTLVTKITQRIGLETLLIAIILIFTMLVIIRRLILRPLSSLLIILKGAAEGKGDLTIEVHEQSKDEIGKLGRYFNLFVKQIRELICKVENSASLVSKASGQMAVSAEETSKAAEEIAMTISYLAEGAGTQAASVRSGREMIDTISKGIVEINRSTESFLSITGKSKDTVERGYQTILTQITAMKENKRTSEAVVEQTNSLAGKSDEIGRIVSVINAIAIQTNLLALNAAIEAARAGEQGKGFAVVAEEVRKLAEQSAEATKEIEELVTEIQAGVTHTQKEVERSSQAVSAQESAVNETKGIFDTIQIAVMDIVQQTESISKATKELGVEVQNMVQTMNHISKIAEESASATQQASAATQEQTASMEEIAASVQHMSNSAEELLKDVKRFIVN